MISIAINKYILLIHILEWQVSNFSNLSVNMISYLCHTHTGETLQIAACEVINRD